MRKYTSYLLRIWMKRDPASEGCNASLEDPHTHEIQIFDSIESLYLYLREVAAPYQSDGLPPEEINTTE